MATKALAKPSDSLYAITGELVELNNLLDAEMEASGGDVSDGTPGAEIQALVKKYQWELTAKVDAYASYIQYLKGKARMVKDEVDRLSGLKKAIDNRVKRMLWMVEFAMHQLAIDRFQGDVFKLSLESNGGVQPMALRDGVTADNIAPRFLKPEIDTEALRKALEAGDPEAAKYAELLPRGKSVRIR